MNKGDLINHVAERAGISKAAADKAMEAVLSGITDSLRRGERVTFVGFGTFGISNRKARKGRNPRTGAALKIPASKSVKFTAGKQLKDVINKRKGKK